MRQLCFAVLLACAVYALPTLTEQKEIQHESPSLQSRRGPFLSREQLSKLPKESLVDLILNYTGTDRSLYKRPRHLASTYSIGWPPIWPQPASFQFDNTTTISVVKRAFVFRVNNPSADLTIAFEKYLDLTFPHLENDEAAQVRGGINEMVVTVANSRAEIQLEVDESYKLVIDNMSATLTAATQVGVFHGLETFSQLVQFDFDSQTYYIPAGPWTIEDAPRFKHREILIDSSRHFLPVSTIKHVIESMTFAKLNVVHWHLVDGQAFPFDSPSYPLLGKNGAYSPEERYTPSDVSEVVEYARARGVRVVVEIDTPGHAGSWCLGYPDICPSAQCNQPLNPATEKTFQVIEGLFSDLTGGQRGEGLFPDNMMHLGGDEVDVSCWSQTPSIVQWMTANNYTTDDAFFYFLQRTQAIAHKMQRDVIGWEEIWNRFGTKLDKSTIMQQWLPGSSIAKECVAAGYRVLWSTAGVWYLDYLQDGWETMYTAEPCDGIDDGLCAQYMLGGGGEQWGETVDTSDILQTIWPRAAAIAERLWSPRNVNDTVAAAPRIANFRCLLNRRGIAAAPYNNANARSAPPGPGGCFVQ